MKVEGYLFIGCAVFFAAADIVYWHFSHDPTGATALALARPYLCDTRGP